VRSSRPRCTAPSGGSRDVASEYQAARENVHAARAQSTGDDKNDDDETPPPAARRASPVRGVTIFEGMMIKKMEGQALGRFRAGGTVFLRRYLDFGAGLDREVRRARAFCVTTRADFVRCQIDLLTSR
jgi:hypothetical protein